MLLEPNQQAFTETTKLVAKKPQKVWFYCIVGEMTSHLPKHSQHKSWIFVLHFTTLNNKIKVKKIQERTKMWLVEDLHPNCEVQSIILGKRKDSAWNSVRMSPNLSKKWAFSNCVERDTWVTKKWRLWSSLASTSLKETQKLLIWNCEAASTHSRWSCWFISGQVEITAPTGVSKDLNGQS